MGMETSQQDNIAKALGRIPSGCSIVTAKDGSRRTGMLASWVQQAAFEPPMVSVAIKKGRPIESIIDGSQSLVLNLIGKDPKTMFKQFGKGFGPEEDAFAGLDTREVDAGIVLDGCMGWLAGKVRSKHEAGDHWLYVVEVKAAEAPAAEAEPYVHLRKNGLNY